MSLSQSSEINLTDNGRQALNAKALANSARSAADNAYNVANNAQKTADGKNSVYRGSDPNTVPTTGLKEGDIYFTDNTLWTWNGSIWEKTVSDTTGAEIHAKVKKAMAESQKAVAEFKSSFEAKVKKLDDEIAQNEIKTGNALNFYKEQYYLSNSYTELVGGSWSDEVPPRKVEGKYVWSRYVTANVGDPTNQQYSDPVCISGLDGDTGPQGPQGVPGPKGADGQTTYVHVAYANSADGKSNFNTSYFNDALYIGVLTDHTQADSTDYTQYTWSRLKGDAGDQGIPGPKGDNGQTTYVHFAYANITQLAHEGGSPKFSLSTQTVVRFGDEASERWIYKVLPAGDYTASVELFGSDPAPWIAKVVQSFSDFSVSESSGRAYIGQYTDYTQADSTDPASYKWTKIKGETGPTGATGPKGADGTDAPTITVKSYTFSATNGGRADIELTGPNAFKQTVYSRGHNVWVLDAKTHKLKEFVNCDTYITMSFNHNGVNTTLADYLASLTDSIVVIAASDADSVDQNVRNVLNSMGGSPELGTWSGGRVGHVFIGMSKRSDGTWPLQPQQGYEEAIHEDGSAPEIGCTLSNGGIVANGATGPKGDTGDTGFFIGTTPPPNPSKGTVWATNDSSGHMNSAKKWDGSNWVNTAFTQDLVAGNISATKIVGGELDVNKITVKNAQNIPITSTVSLGQKLSDIEQDADGISTTVRNLHAGDRNLARGAASSKDWFVFQGFNNRTNYGCDFVDYSLGTLKAGDKVTFGITMKNEGVTSGTMLFQQHGNVSVWNRDCGWISPTGNVIDFVPNGAEKALTYTITITDGMLNGNSRYIIGFRTDNVPAGGKLSFRYAFVKKGTLATDWTPAPEDVDDSVSQIKQTADSLNAYVKGSRGSDTLKAILSMDPNNSTIGQVVNGQVVAAINTSSDGSVKIDGKTLHITADTKIENAVIKSAMIDSVEANKIKSGVLDASQITVINLDANSITTGSLSAVVNDLRKFENYTVSASSPWDFNNTKLSYGNWFLIGETTADHVYNGPSYPGGQKLTPYMYVTSRGSSDGTRFTVTVWKDNDPTQYQRVWNGSSWSDWVMLPNSQNLVSAINLSPDSVKISGKNIELNGDTTIHGQLNLLPTDQREVDQRSQGFHNPWDWRDANVFAGSGGLQLQSTIVSQSYSNDNTSIGGLRGDSSAAITTVAPTYLKFTVYPSWSDVANNFSNQLARTYIDAGRIETNDVWVGNFRLKDSQMRGLNDSLYVANWHGTNFDNAGSVGFQVWGGIGLGRNTIYTPSSDLYIQIGNVGPGLGARYSESGKVDVHCNRVISQRANTVSSRLSLKTDITPVSYDRALAAVEGTEMYDYRYTTDDTGQHYVSGIIDDVNPDPQYHMDDMLINKERTARIDANLVGYHHVVLQELLKKIDKLEIKLKSLETILESKEN